VVMRRMRQRLERLEGTNCNTSRQAKGTPSELQSYFRALANFRRAQVGLEPEYTAVDLEDDRRSLEETIPILRASPGWQTEEAQAMLDRWEVQTRELLQKGI
jgi:hypothetical protein